MRTRHVVILVAVVACTLVRPAAGGTLDGFVLFASDALKAARLRVTAGDVGGGKKIDAARLDAAASRLFAPAVRLRGAARCAELHANAAKGAGKACALTGNLSADPVGDVATACTFPQPFGSCNPGAPVTVKKGKQTALPPGTYGTVRLGAGAHLVLDGAYTFCAIVAQRKGVVSATAGSQVRVTDVVALGSVAAAGASFAIAGAHVKLGPGVVAATVCAPRAEVKAARVVLTGSLAALRLRLARVVATRSAGGATTTTSAATTTTTIPPPPAGYLDFVVEDHSSDACGTVAPGTCPSRLIGNPSAQLSCSGMNTGAVGSVTTSETALPPGSTLRLGVANCVGDVCDIVANPIQSPGQFDCSTTGCLFGPPEPVQIIVSACLVTRFTAPVTGAIDLATGVATVNAVTGTDLHIGATCPICDTGGVAGSPGSPATGTCSGGATPGASCTTTNADQLSTACLPAGATLATIPSTLALTTGTATLSAGSGVICPGQAAPGCFGNSACTTISVSGAAAGSLKDQLPHPTRLVSAFCVPSVDAGLVDASAGFPGPGTVAVSGQARFLESAPVTTTSTTSTTSTTTTSTTTTTSASTTTTTLIPLVTHFSAAASGTSATSTSVLVPAGGIPAGSSVIVFFATNPGVTVTGASDPVNGSYTLENTALQGSGTSGAKLAIFAKHDIASALPANTLITITHSSTNKRLHTAFYVRNLATSSQLDGAALANGSSTTPATGQPVGTPAFAREAFFSAFAIEIGTNPTFTPTAGWTYNSTTAARITGLSLFVEYKVMTSAAFANAGVTYTGAAERWAAIQQSYEGR